MKRDEDSKKNVIFAMTIPKNSLKHVSPARKGIR